MFSDPFPQQLFARYEQYRDPRLSRRRFPADTLARMLREWDDDPVFEVRRAGLSYQNRDIFLLKAGTGKTRVLLWSQMHGDEATATLALLDLFRFLARPGELKHFRDKMLSQTTLYFVPMLNPDGAEAFERRNAQCLDINRDARRLQSPEGRLLKSLQQELKPHFGFNLHDQNPRYTAGKTRHAATISLLAPPLDDQNTLNATRLRAVQLVAGLNQTLQAFIPHQVGRWPDDFEPRAFGENMQLWGTSTVLVESGGFARDPEKQFIRKLNFTLLLDACHQIATGAYAATPPDGYAAIPQNERYLFDLLLRSVNVAGHRTDIGVNRTEKTVGIDFYHKSLIEDWGDLSVFFGYEELDASALTLREGRLCPVVMETVADLEKADWNGFLRQGYVAVRVNTLTPVQRTALRVPLHVIGPHDTFDPKACEGREAHFLLMENDKVKYAVINGTLHRL